MNIEGWKYYNYAAIPTCAPDENPDLTPIKKGTIWRLGGRKLYLQDGHQIGIADMKQNGGM